MTLIEDALPDLLPDDLLSFNAPNLYAQRKCTECGVPTLYLLFSAERRASERTLAGCPQHRLEPHCVFCCAGFTWRR